MRNITHIKTIILAALLVLGGINALQASTEVTPPKAVDGSATLSPRQAAIPLIAVFMATSNMEQLNNALNKGLDAGLTVSESKEILVQLYAYTGFPRSLNALSELKKVVDNRRLKGIHDVEGKEPVAAIPVGEELRRLGLANQTKISGAPVQGPLFDFAPVINQFLQTHLFGDIFARDNLDWQSRELATVGALAATSGVEAQLLSHMRASLRVGLSAGQLQQVVNVLQTNGASDAAMRAENALKRALASMN
ncbi:carboxymuconolactone decarboxylase family protein [Pantoea rwandensis]|uniref:Carboxymuconolactone decarboxylase n=1 Tax=Pantoea rwandensis TaxID=1076550 RepID=A0A1X1D508_9GAMM|nr:carboxymuconolactone decarboxylase family protein [Pantoea rwandensis]ORM71769.1 carboxymuconolactone decarboxylase [Pantoea rwandensis]